MGASGFGLGLRLGAQISDRFGIETDVAFGLSGFLQGPDFSRFALTFDFTPNDWFTLGVGPMARHDDGARAAIFTAERVNSLGGTVRLDLHAPSDDPSRRKGFVNSLAVDVGSGSYLYSESDLFGNAPPPVTGTGTAAAATLSMGWVWY